MREGPVPKMSISARRNEKKKARKERSVQRSARAHTSSSLLFFSPSSVVQLTRSRSNNLKHLKRGLTELLPSRLIPFLRQLDVPKEGFPSEQDRGSWENDSIRELDSGDGGSDDVNARGGGLDGILDGSGALGVWEAVGEGGGEGSMGREREREMGRERGGSEESGYAKGEGEDGFEHDGSKGR